MKLSEPPSTADPGLTAGQRLHALDSLRGIAALLVALFHFHGNGLIGSLPLVRNGNIFVDFFFVLSGYILSLKYTDKIGVDLPIVRFMILRLGRVYPLHLAVLLLLVFSELALLVTGNLTGGTRAAFAGDRGFAELFMTALLLNCFDLTRSTWNLPSWSIAAEVWTYLIFALITAYAGRFIVITMASLAIFASCILVWYSPDGLFATLDYGWARCLLGFGVGVCSSRFKLRRGGTLIEMLCLAVALNFVVLARGPLVILAPLAFAPVIIVFARQGGLLSTLLARKAFSLLGTLSYSVYLLHPFVEARFLDILLGVGKMTGARLVERVDQVLILRTDPMMSDALTVIMVAVLCAAAALSYNYIELPSRAHSREIVTRLGPRFNV